MLSILLVLATQNPSPNMPESLAAYYRFARATPAVVVRWKVVTVSSAGKRAGQPFSHRAWLASNGAVRHDLGNGSTLVWSTGKGIQTFRETKEYRLLGSWGEAAGDPMISYGLLRPKRDPNAQEWGYLVRKDAHAGLDIVSLRSVLGIDAQTEVTWVLGASDRRLVRLIVEDITIAGATTKEYQVLGFRRLASASARVFNTMPPKGYRKVVTPSVAGRKKLS